MSFLFAILKKCRCFYIVNGISVHRRGSLGLDISKYWPLPPETYRRQTDRDWVLRLILIKMNNAVADEPSQRWEDTLTITVSFAFWVAVVTGCERKREIRLKWKVIQPWHSTEFRVQSVSCLLSLFIQDCWVKSGWAKWFWLSFSQRQNRIVPVSNITSYT